MGMLEGLAGIGALMLVFGAIYNIELLVKVGVGLIIVYVITKALIGRA